MAGAYNTTGVTLVPSSTRAQIGFYTIDGGPRGHVMFDWEQNDYDMKARLEELSRNTFGACWYANCDSPPGTPGENHRGFPATSYFTKTSEAAKARSCTAAHLPARPRTQHRGFVRPPCLDLIATLYFLPLRTGALPRPQL